MAIKILVDSGSDILYEEATMLNISLISMQITINDITYLDGVDLDHKTFYHLLKTESNFPKTSLLSPHVYLEEFKKVKASNDELIVITISSSLSGTYQSALAALDMIKYDKISIIDSLSASLGQRLLVEEAVRLRDNNTNAKEIVATLEKLKTKIKAFAIVNTLEYLHKGGRLSKTSAFIGNLVNLKPIITFKEDGKLGIAEKSLGKARAVKQLLELVNDNPVDENYPLYYLYAINNDDTIKLSNQIAKKFNKDYKNYIHEIGPTIGSHVGPGVIGLIYVSQEK